MSRPQLVFVSPRFLFPAHSGGAIRTGQILRGIKGGRFSIKLLSPGSPEAIESHRAELMEIADECEFWTAANSEDRSRFSKARHLMSRLPLAVAADRSASGRRLVARCLNTQPAVVVGDFVHAGVLLPQRVAVPTVIFTHNCEAEIYERHAQQAGSCWMRAIWRSQAAKTRRFESEVLRRAGKVVAVAERDAKRFERDYGIRGVETIPTGVDLDAFCWEAPRGEARVVFAGSMDSPANADGVEWMIEHVWTSVLAAIPEATMTVVGKAPPARLVRLGESLRGFTFTGRVPLVAPHLAGADAFVIPLLVGGGTRMKAFEAMAAGVPVVSTSVGVEGLGLVPDRDYLQADDAAAFAGALIRLLRDPDLGRGLSSRAHAFVERNGSHRAAAQRFEEICWGAASALSTAVPLQRPPLGDGRLDEPLTDSQMR